MAYTTHGNEEAVAMLFAALSQVQGKLGGAVPKNRTVKVRLKTGGSYEYSYTTLDAILSAAAPHMAAHEVGVVQFPHSFEGETELVTHLTHSGGAYLEVRNSLGRRNDIQELGKMITYMRRYVVQGLLGVAAEEDTDGPDRDGQTKTVEPKEAKRDESSTPKPAEPPDASHTPETYAKLLVELEEAAQGDMDMIKTALEAWSLPNRVVQEMASDSPFAALDAVDNLDRLVKRTRALRQFWHRRQELKILGEDFPDIKHPWKATDPKLRQTFNQMKARLEMARQKAPARKAPDFGDKSND